MTSNELFGLEQIFNLDITEEEFEKRMDSIVENITEDKFNGKLMNPELLKEIDK